MTNLDKTYHILTTNFVIICSTVDVPVYTKEILTDGRIGDFKVEITLLDVQDAMTVRLKLGVTNR